MSPQIIASVSYAGVLVQLVGALLLVGLFALLRRHVLRRGYFRAWTIAWEAMAAALCAVVLRLHLQRPDVLELMPWARGAGLPLRGVYLYSKLIMLAYLVAGAVMYATGRRVVTHLRWAGAILALYVLAVMPVIAHSPRTTALLQAPWLVGGLVFSAWLLFRLPPSRRTLGNRAVAGGFLAMALLWSLYPVAFGPPYIGDANTLLGWAATYSSYLDLVCQMGLGYAMVVVLMEDAKREVDDAQSELRVAHDRLRRDALYDALTGSLNRRAFAEGVGLDAARHAYGAVALLDLDNLKEVNDEHGHAGGDALLQHLVETLREGLRASDKVYRWGGDEFLLVVPQARAAELQTRITDLIHSAAPVTFSVGDPVPLEVSVGAVDFASGEELEKAISLADAGMYREKHRRKLARLTPGTLSAQYP